MTPSVSGWAVQSETHQIPASKMWISQGLQPSCGIAGYCTGFPKMRIWGNTPQPS
jgi:hypothetical protein